MTKCTIETIEKISKRVRREAIRILKHCSRWAQNENSRATQILALLDKREPSMIDKNKIIKYFEHELPTRIAKRACWPVNFEFRYEYMKTVKDGENLEQIGKLLKTLLEVSEKYPQLQDEMKTKLDESVSSLWDEMSNVKNSNGFTSSLWHYLIVFCKAISDCWQRILGQSTDEKSMPYAGAIRNSFWKDEAVTRVEELDQINSHLVTIRAYALTAL